MDKDRLQNNLQQAGAGMGYDLLPWSLASSMHGQAGYPGTAFAVRSEPTAFWMEPYLNNNNNISQTADAVGNVGTALQATNQQQQEPAGTQCPPGCLSGASSVTQSHTTPHAYGFMTRPVAAESGASPNATGPAPPSHLAAAPGAIPSWRQGLDLPMSQDRPALVYTQSQQQSQKPEHSQLRARSAILTTSRSASVLVPAPGGGAGRSEGGSPSYSHSAGSALAPPTLLHRKSTDSRAAASSLERSAIVQSYAQSLPYWSQPVALPYQSPWGTSDAAGAYAAMQPMLVDGGRRELGHRGTPEFGFVDGSPDCRGDRSHPQPPPVTTQTEGTSAVGSPRQGAQSALLPVAVQRQQLRRSAMALGEYDPEEACCSPLKRVSLADPGGHFCSSPLRSSTGSPAQRTPTKLAAGSIPSPFAVFALPTTTTAPAVTSTAAMATANATHAHIPGGERMATATPGGAIGRHRVTFNAGGVMRSNAGRGAAVSAGGAAAATAAGSGDRTSGGDCQEQLQPWHAQLGRVQQQQQDQVQFQAQEQWQPGEATSLESRRVALSSVSNLEQLREAVAGDASLPVREKMDLLQLIDNSLRQRPQQREQAGGSLGQPQSIETQDQHRAGAFAAAAPGRSGPCWGAGAPGGHAPVPPPALPSERVRWPSASGGGALGGDEPLLHAARSTTGGGAGRACDPACGQRLSVPALGASSVPGPILAANGPQQAPPGVGPPRGHAVEPCASAFRGRAAAAAAAAAATTPGVPRRTAASDSDSQASTVTAQSDASGARNKSAAANNNGTSAVVPMHVAAVAEAAGTFSGPALAPEVAAAPPQAQSRLGSWGRLAASPSVSFGPLVQQLVTPFDVRGRGHSTTATAAVASAQQGNMLLCQQAQRGPLPQQHNHLARPAQHWPAEVEVQGVPPGCLNAAPLHGHAAEGAQTECVGALLSFGSDPYAPLLQQQQQACQTPIPPSAAPTPPSPESPFRGQTGSRGDRPSGGVGTSWDLTARQATAAADAVPAGAGPRAVGCSHLRTADVPSDCLGVAAAVAAEPPAWEPLASAFAKPVATAGPGAGASCGGPGGDTGSDGWRENGIDLLLLGSLGDPSLDSLTDPLVSPSSNPPGGCSAVQQQSPPPRLGPCSVAAPSDFFHPSYQPQHLQPQWDASDEPPSQHPPGRAAPAPAIEEGQGGLAEGGSFDLLDNWLARAGSPEPELVLLPGDGAEL